MSKRIRDGGPAFPTRVAQPFGDGCLAQGGMSLRDWFAGMATDKDVAAYQQDEYGRVIESRVAARYQFAKEMLKAREVQS